MTSARSKSRDVSYRVPSLRPLLFLDFAQRFSLLHTLNAPFLFFEPTYNCTSPTMIRSVGLTASLALAANAFMIPSTMTVPNLNLEALNPAQYIQDNSAKVVKLPCPGCSFEGAHGVEQVDNDMVSNNLRRI